MKTDIEIAQNAKMKSIFEIAKELGIEENIEYYGKYKAKILLDVIEKTKNKKNGKYIGITAITPTPLGEGKTVTTIGLSMALNKIGKKAISVIRQPSLGPVFGIKGGAAGGGYSQVLPMEDFNLHLTGDFHAVGLAHNLLSAFIDAHIFHQNKLGINPNTITWRRVVDVNDRALRDIVIGLGGKENGYVRETGFDITAASEVMAILALTTSLADLRKMISRIVIGFSYDGVPITAEDLKCDGAMTILLKDAIKPNLLQTIENTPCLVHAGPFANIAHGNSSILADLIAIKLGEYVVTESGFGTDCGAEKLLNIKCRYSGIIPDAMVIVCSIRALKTHSGKFNVVAGKPLDPNLLKEDIEAVEQGCSNLIKHIENIKLFNLPVVVAINKFTQDTDKEIETIRKIAYKAGADEVCLSEVWLKGGNGGIELAHSVAKVANKKNNFQFLYSLDMPIKQKIEIIAKKIYGAKDIFYSIEAEKKIRLYTKLGYDKLPICMAKTHLSLSHDKNLKGRPTDFCIPIYDIKTSIGAGFLYPLLGEIKTMPGLSSIPAGTQMDIDENGNIKGLF